MLTAQAVKPPATQQQATTPARPPLTRSAETQSYILDTVRANPDAVLDALAILYKDGQLANLATRATAPDTRLQAEESDDTEEADFVAMPNVEDTANAFVGGNPDGKITIVSFFDYNCPHCRTAHPVVADAVAAGGDIRVIYREFPIMSPGSVFASRAALAARNQNMYEQLHHAMMTSGVELDDKTVLQVARAVASTWKSCKPT